MIEGLRERSDAKRSANFVPKKIYQLTLILQPSDGLPQIEAGFSLELEPEFVLNTKEGSPNRLSTPGT